MNWNVTVQIAGLVILYLGGIVVIGRYMATTLGQRIDDLRNQMTREHDTLARKVDELAKDFGAEIHDVRTEMREMRTEMREMRTEMREMRAEMPAEMREIRTEMRANADQLHQNLMNHVEFHAAQNKRDPS